MERHNGRRQSVPTPSAYAAQLRPRDANYVHIQPASPEVISSLITSLSIISSPASQLFDEASSPQSPTARHFQGGSGVRGSFGIDYGAFNQPSLADTQEEGSLDDLAASPPVVRTSKPPSGYSPLTAPNAAGKDGNSIKAFLRGSSRPTSKDSNASKDRDDVSIGGLSIEPGVAPLHELSRQSSSDSWGKKQGRNQKGLMYMSSKERLRDSERKRANNPTGLGLERVSIPRFDTESFMAENPIKEETSLGKGELLTSPELDDAAPSPGIGSPGLTVGGVIPGGIGSGRYIPTRDSSLRMASSSRKRSSARTSRQSSKQREEDVSGTIKEVDEGQGIQESQSTEKKRGRQRAPIETTSKLQGPLKSQRSIELFKMAAHSEKQSKTVTQVDGQLGVADEEDGAPSPAVGQRKSRVVDKKADLATNKNRRSGGHTPDLLERPTKKDGAKINRLSGSMAGVDLDKEKRASQPLSRKDLSSPEPGRVPDINVEDRPSSADSIDDAVDAYLCSPRLSQKIRHPQTGRKISFSEVGDPEGFAVFCCVGMGLTRYITAFYDELALTLKLRLITPDRPGVGDSEPYTDGTATPLSWPDDVYAICQTLKVTKFSILAHSAGAIYALATALRMPQHIRGRIHLLAPWIPPSQLNAFGAQQVSPPTGSIPTSQRILRALPTPILKAANSSFMSATSSSITSSLPKSPRRSKRKSAGAPSGRNTSTPTPVLDKENQVPTSSIYPKPSNPSAFERAVANPLDPNSEAAVLAAAALTLADKERQVTYDTRLTHAIWDLATTGANPAVDLLVCLERRHTIGFRYVDINRAVVIHHGTKDTRVPVENVKWLGKMMRKCEVRILEGEGHGLMASAAVMGGVLMEIAREWEDWMRVVERKPEPNGRAARVLRERASVGAFR